LLTERGLLANRSHHPKNQEQRCPALRSRIVVIIDRMSTAECRWREVGKSRSIPQDRPGDGEINRRRWSISQTRKSWSEHWPFTV